MDKMADNNDNKTDLAVPEITQELYKRNAELHIRNKTLDLLGKLYGISIKTLDPSQLAKEVTNLIQRELDFEFAGIFEYNKEEDVLKLVSFAGSDRFNNHVGDADHFIAGTKIQNASSKKLFHPVLKDHILHHVDGSGDIFHEDKHIKTTLAYPLSAGGVMAVLVLSLNRSYETLSDFEQQSIGSFIDVIAVSLAKATLYKELQISNNKLAESNIKLKALDKQKTEFVSMASHQLKSPLTAIKGYSSMLLEGSFGPLGDKARDAASVVFQSSQKLVMIIEDFLNITRIELGTMKYTFSELDLAKVAKTVVDELKMTIESKGLKITFNAEPGEFKVKADLGKISQVIGNVIDNASKYTPKGSIDVSVKRVGDKIHFETVDTGVGIDPEVMPKLFQKFMRADDAGRVNIQGTGQGLYVAKQLIEGQGGKIWAESAGKNQGAKFIVELPAV